MNIKHSLHVSKLIRHVEQYKLLLNEFNQFIKQKNLLRYLKVFNEFNIHTIDDLTSLLVNYPNIFDKKIMKQDIDLIMYELKICQELEGR